MKLGLNTGYWSAGPPPGVEDQIAEADRLGFDSVWTAEAYGSDCFTPLAWWGASTENVKLGTLALAISYDPPTPNGPARTSCSSKLQTVARCSPPAPSPTAAAC